MTLGGYRPEGWPLITQLADPCNKNRVLLDLCPNSIKESGMFRGEDE